MEKRVIHRVKCCRKGKKKERTEKYRMNLSTRRVLVILERELQWRGGDGSQIMMGLGVNRSYLLTCYIVWENVRL